MNGRRRAIAIETREGTQAENFQAIAGSGLCRELGSFFGLFNLPPGPGVATPAVVPAYLRCVGARPTQ